MTSHIFMILMDVPAELEDRFNRLYDTDHALHMIEVPGNLRCDRYRLEWSDNADMLRYLTLFEIAEPDLPRSDAWKAQAAKGAWSTEMRPHVTARRNGVFRRIADHTSGVEPFRDHIYFLQQAVPGEIEERFNHLYDTDHIPLMLQTPGARDCRRLQLEYSDTGDVPDYLAIYGIEAPDVPRSPEWKAQTAKGAWPVEMRPHFTARRNGGFTRIAEHIPQA